MRAPRVVIVTDFGVVREAELLRRLDALAALPSEARARLAVQLREPEMEARDKLRFGERLQKTRALGAKLVVNDRLDLAALLGADGIHLGRRSVSVAEARRLARDAFVTRACHDVAEVLAAAREGADGALLSPIFASPGKGTPLGRDALGEARRLLDGDGFDGFALLALGGVDAANAGACLAAGASGVAVVPRDLGPALAALLS